MEHEIKYNDIYTGMKSEHDLSEEIFLMKPFLPPIADMLPYLERIWASRQLTNGGSVHAEFEQAIADYLGVNYISLFANGTLALMIALKTMNLQGEVITTPFTSPATLQAIYWNNLKPVFVDVNETDLNINSSLIEAAISPLTAAILPVHIFGAPCDVDQIKYLSKKYNLKVLYDAAHCFGVQMNGNSLCNYGDLSVLSFHATKVFNTFEGGAIVCHDKETKQKIDALKNTGIDQDHKLCGYGFNAKMNEIQSAFGLCQLKYVDTVIEMRKAATMHYRKFFSQSKGLRMLIESENIRHNYSYLSILIDPEVFGASRDELFNALQSRNIVSRKYFSPLLSDTPEFEMYKTHDLPVAEKIARNILCLPLFHDISGDQISRIVDTINHLHRE